jgi:hypothetical protein
MLYYYEVVHNDGGWGARCRAFRVLNAGKILEKIKSQYSNHNIIHKGDKLFFIESTSIIVFLYSLAAIPINL